MQKKQLESLFNTLSRCSYDEIQLNIEGPKDSNFDIAKDLEKNNGPQEIKISPMMQYARKFKQVKSIKDIFKDRVSEKPEKTEFQLRHEKELWKKKSLLQQFQQVKKKQKQQALAFVNKLYKKTEKPGLKNIQRYKTISENHEKPKEKTLTIAQRNRLAQQKIRKQYSFAFKEKKPEQKIQSESLRKIFEEDQLKIERKKIQCQKITDLGYIHFQRNNYSSLIRLILSHQFNKQLLEPQVKKVPNIFPEKQSYKKIFEFLIINEAIASLHNAFQNFRNTAKYQKPSKMKIKISKQTQDGFIMFQGQQKDYSKDQDQYKLIKNLSLSKFNLVLISKEKNFNPRSYSNQQFMDNFLFLGCLISPENRDQLAANVRILTYVNSKNFIRYHGKQWIDGYVFEFQKISTFIREFLAIRNIQFQDLAEFIYNPLLMENYTQNYVSHPEIFQKFFQRLGSLFNNTQLTSIKQLSLRDKGIIMLQGPPGTGKTSTLLGVLAGQYHYLKQRNELSKIKILVCTPSNTAIDHIVKRIVKQGLITPTQKYVKPKILRIGLLQSNDQLIRSVYLDSLCQLQVLEEMKNLQLDMKLTIPQIKDKITSLSKQIRKLQYQYENTKEKQIKQKITKKIFQRQDYQSRAFHLRKQRIDQKSKYNEIQRRLLNQAEIICTTLSSTGSDKLQKFNGRFSCLIIDEAGQCTQPNLLIPLKLNIKKVLLIGDPCQLPATTFSPDSNITLYNRSMFQRMIDAGLKPYFLDIQYRMSSQIRLFPSKFFYRNRLKDDDSILKRQYPSQFKKFKDRNVIFIDTKFGIQRLFEKSYQNEGECLVIKNLCQLLNLQKLDVGIITPYKQQMRKISTALKYQKNIFVNTIDSFQGQEKDLIIISTVRANHSKESNKVNLGFLIDERRINVALTRSKFLLIIVGHADTLASNEVWNALLDELVKRKCYFKIQQRQNLFHSLRRLCMNQSHKQEETYNKINHKKLTKDLRKLDREQINLQDFNQNQQGQYKEEQQIEQKNSIKKETSDKDITPLIIQKKEIKVEQKNNEQIWSVEAAMKRTQNQLKQKFGEKSILDLLFM